MRLTYIQLISTLALLVVLCLILSDPAEGRRSKSSRSTSRSRSSRSSRSKSGSSRTPSTPRTRSTGSKIKKKIKKGTKKVKKGVKKLVKKFKKLPGASIKLAEILSVDRRLTREERRIVWSGIVWDSSPRLRRTAYYLRYPCRRRFTDCREKAVSQSANADLGYCMFMDSDKLCLTQGSGGCSQREHHWLRVAACNSGSDTPIVDWANSTWHANQVLKLAVQSSSTLCQSQFERCRKEASGSGDVESYCAMVHDYKTCLLANASCPEQKWSAFADAACERTAVNWADTKKDYPPPSYSLRLTTAIVSPDCQLELEKCREDEFTHQKSNPSYCNLINNQEKCLTQNSSCTQQEWFDLRDAACNIGFVVRGSPFVCVLLVLSSFLGMVQP